jgi:signal transduction histidine kinase
MTTLGDPRWGTVLPRRTQLLVAMTAAVFVGLAIAIALAFAHGRRIGCHPSPSTVCPMSLAQAVARPGTPRDILLVAALVAIASATMTAAAVSVARDIARAHGRADLVAGVSHELRMPLAQILLYGESLALGRAQGIDAHDAAVRTIVREARRLTALVDNVLYCARAAHNNSTIYPTTVDLTDFVEDTLLALIPAAADSGATIVLAVTPHTLVRAETGALRQVVLNLVDNALKYGPPAQHVTIGAEGAASGLVHLWVEDEGPGVPADQARHIFKAFERLTRDRQGPVAGSGLGLAVVDDLVTRLHGRVWVTPGRSGGARFVVELPVPSGTETA